jgi:ribosome-binding protein aMBF1 (putative translation factor)
MITFIDSTKIAVCHIIRAKRNKAFNGTAKHGKGTIGWFFGFKLHLRENQLGDIVIDNDLAILFGQNLKLARVKRNITQEELCEMANLDRSYLSKIEHGHIS